MDAHVIEVIRAVGRETDAPQELVEAVVRGARPSIRLVPQLPREGEVLRLGGCRLGGLPDLPEGVEWPRLSAALKFDPAKRAQEDEPLWFLAQIDLAEVAFADLAKLLPSAGMLYFFFHWHPADEPDAPDAGFVLFHKGGERPLRRTEAPADMHSGGHFRGVDLLPRLEWTVPSCDDTNYNLPFWDNLDYRVAQVQGLEDGWGPAPAHRMLGYPEVLQFWELAEGEQLLLQLCSDGPSGIPEMGPYPETGMMWGDGGRIYYLMPESDLKSQHFGKVWAHLEDQ
jgi:hypothetical protein